MFTGMEMMTCPNLAVSAEVMQHVVHVESGSNPYAIGVVGGQLVRQPQNLGEALATVHMLDAKGYNYSLGVAQVNRANLGRYGLDSYEKAFEVCPNLSAGARILAACYTSSGGDWGKAFSCYYSGNFVTGYRDGYVQKVYDSINRSANVADGNPAQAIPLQATPNGPRSSKVNMTIMPADSSAYRVALRSAVLDTALAAAIPSAAALMHGAGDTTQTAPDQPQAAPAPATVSETTAAPVGTAPKPATAPATAATSDVFVPQVRGPNDPLPAPATPAAPAQVAATSDPSKPAVDRADLRQESRDGAFVF